MLRSSENNLEVFNQHTHQRAPVETRTVSIDPPLSSIFNDSMQEIIKELELRLKGLNYVTSFDFVELGTVGNLEVVKALIKKIYPESDPFSTSITAVSKEDFWADIQFGFDFRGKKSGGMRRLNSREEDDLKILQESFKTEIRKHFTDDTKFYKYASNTGMPSYVAYWGFRLLFNRGDQWLFLQGSASD